MRRGREEEEAKKVKKRESSDPANKVKDWIAAIRAAIQFLNVECGTQPRRIIS